MYFRKVTEGHVAQVFDTETGEFISQQFHAGDCVSYEDENGEAIDSGVFCDKDGKEAYLPFDMEQPYIETGLMSESNLIRLIGALLTGTDAEIIMGVFQLLSAYDIEYNGDSMFTVTPIELG